MAAELIAGGFLSATLQVAFERLTSLDTRNYFRSRKLVDGLLKELHITLISINQVLEDAEEMQYRNPNVKQWLDELKDAVYVADDLLDEIAIEAEKQTTGNKVRNFFIASVRQFDKEIESRVREVLDNLDFLAKQKDVLGLKEGRIARSGGGKKRLPTTSFVDESSMYGRDGDKEKLVNFLLSEDICTRQPHVISIVGMGGMGKTSLSQLVYNDERMDDQFELKAWVCVSEDFDVVRVTKLILEALHCSIGDTKDLNSLQHQLKGRLMGKKFLLVLDDVWNESRISWEALQVPFTFNSSGSKVLVTTRSEKVALVMRSIEIHHLKLLEDEDCWKLFTRTAFNDQDADAYANLESIGRKIVDKCKGLPLAIKTLGSLLNIKMSHQEWVKILESDLWDLSENDSDIIPALRLSYHYLPSKLKRCFAYCSIFPKDYEINKDDLIQLWMAEGLLQYCETNKCVEGLGNEFFNELESRCFFQQSQRQDNHFIMHDLLNDLAKLVSGEFCFRLGEGKVFIPKKVRHCSYMTNFYEECGILKPLTKCHQMRSFVRISVDWIFSLNINLFHDLIRRFKYLRVLSLPRYTNSFKLIGYISKLKHLRYLDLSYSDIKKLPSSICKLHNLQTLKLNHCRELIELPSDLHKLINLHHLEFYESGKIRKFSIKIGRLNHLRTLSSFFVSKHSGCSIKELGKLKHLQGRLSILELENVIDPTDAVEAKLKDKTSMDELLLQWNKGNGDSEIERRVLDALQPHSNLKKLTIRGNGGTGFPDWLGSHYLFNLVTLELRGSKHCLSLPSLGQLPSLKELCVSGFDAIVTVGSEFYGDISSNRPFRCLERLAFHFMEQWEEWIIFDCDNENEYFPCLRVLDIRYCPKLRKALPPCLPSMRTLVISNCQLFEPPSFPKAAHLEALSFGGLRNLKSLPENMHTLYPSLRKLFLFQCEQLESLPQWDLPSSLEEFSLLGCPKLIASRQEWGLHKFHSLTYFCVSDDFENVKSFPEEGLLPPNIKRLEFHFCSKLKSINYRGLLHLKSLQSLEIFDCPSLQCLPEEGLPNSLSYLDIQYCPLLQLRCQTEKGQDWHKISHIPHLRIGNT